MAHSVYKEYVYQYFENYNFLNYDLEIFNKTCFKLKRTLQKYFKSGCVIICL